MKVLTKYLGYLLIISAFFRALPITAGIIYEESIITFIFSAALSLTLGIALLIYSKSIIKKESGLNLTKGLMLVALSFIILPLIGSISFLPSFNYNPANAIFESISGFTTTGLTMYHSIEGLPKSLLLWRAETQWMGGIGIIMVFLFFFSRLRAHTYSITETDEAAEKSMALYQTQDFIEKTGPNPKKTIRNILLIYTGLTALAIGALYLSNMSLYESIGMAFTSISTGGFTINDTLHTNNFQLVVLSVLMLFGATSFMAHKKIFQFKFLAYLKTFEKNVFLIILAATILLTLLTYSDIGTVIFHLTSAFTTTGYTITPIALLPQFFLLMIIIGMLIGGNIGSTAGGIKVFRVYYFTKAIPWMIKKLSSPVDAIIPFQIRKKPLERGSLLKIGIYIFCYLLLILLGTIIFMLCGNNLFDSFFQNVSAIGTVGMQTMDLYSQNLLCKITLMIMMLFGRLEIFPLLILARNIVKKQK